MNWRDQARCLGTSIGVFFANANDESPGISESYDEARAICAECPVQSPCLEYAITTRQPNGIWGGLDNKERRSIRDRRRNTERAAYFHEHGIKTGRVTARKKVGA